MASIAPTMTTDLAAPNGHKGSWVAIGATPSQDVAIGSLDNGKDMTGALVGHVDHSWQKLTGEFLVSMGYSFLMFTTPQNSHIKHKNTKTRETGNWKLASITWRSGEGFQVLGLGEINRIEVSQLRRWSEDERPNTRTNQSLYILLL